MANNEFKGCWPVAPTPFKPNGEVDKEGMKRVIDCMVDQKVDGICILANYSEQFLLSDEERELLTKLCIEHVAGRVPVITTVSHFSTDIALSRAKLVKALGGEMIMMMAPYHGALMKGTPQQTFEQFSKASRNDLAKKEKKEMEIIKQYLPEEISENEIVTFKNIVKLSQVSSILSAQSVKSWTHTTVLAGKKSNSEIPGPLTIDSSIRGIIDTADNFRSLNCVSGSINRIDSISLPNNSTR